MAHRHRHIKYTECCSLIPIHVRSLRHLYFILCYRLLSPLGMEAQARGIIGLHHRSIFLSSRSTSLPSIILIQASAYGTYSINCMANPLVLPLPLYGQTFLPLHLCSSHSHPRRTLLSVSLLLLFPLILQ